MRILQFFDSLDVVKLDVQVLIHTLEGSLELDVILELYSYLVVYQCLEEAV